MRVGPVDCEAYSYPRPGIQAVRRPLSRTYVFACFVFEETVYPDIAPLVPWCSSELVLGGVRGSLLVETSVERAMSYILALDQGTTSSRAILFDAEGNVAAKAQHEFPQIFPKPGWVEHDPFAILTSQLTAAIEALGKLQLRPRDVAGVGITNQRETTIVWDREIGQAGL